MIQGELVLLGLLKEGPKHGYDIKIKIKEILELFAGVDLKSIYYPLRILEKKGLVVKKKSKEGRRPERIVYALTAKGNSRFEELLSKSLLHLKRPQFSLDLSLYFLHYMKPPIARRRLKARLLILKKIARGLQLMAGEHSFKKDQSLGRILEHNIKMLEAESVFLTQLVERI
jgi:DNA-binding PadR family transcriptional regulator